MLSQLPLGRGTNQAVLELHEGDAVTIPVAGDMSQGCKFLMQRWELERFITCCYSDRRRGETLCDPKKQSQECREAEMFRVDEETGQDTSGNCTLRLVGGAEAGDTGTYTVFFPGRLQDNSKFEVIMQSGTRTWRPVAAVLVVLAGIGLACWLYVKKKACFKDRRELNIPVMEFLLKCHTRAPPEVEENIYEGLLLKTPVLLSSTKGAAEQQGPSLGVYVLEPGEAFYTQRHTVPGRGMCLYRCRNSYLLHAALVSGLATHGLCLQMLVWREEA
jgi:hypothetical protein